MSILSGQILRRSLMPHLTRSGTKSIILPLEASMIATEAKQDLGTYGPGWPPLAEATVARKKTGDSPLLETGALRDSIEWSSSGLEGAVGTDDPRGAWMELGTSRVPPRPWLWRAAVAEEEEIREMVAREFGDLVSIRISRPCRP